MKIGINGTGLVARASIEAISEDAARAHAQGFSSYWLAEHPTGGFDALTVLSIVGREVPDIELGTAIIPTMPRHPLVLAGQALTTANAINQRLTLGIGLSHKVMMEELGIGFDKPIRHLREYLEILMPLLESGQVDYSGETLKTKAKVFRAPDKPVPVVVAALGPQALKVTGRLADGTTLAWVGPKTIESHIVPTLSAAAAEAGRASPRVIATLPVCVTEETEAVRSLIAENLKMYGQLPSYRAMLDREGVDGPADVALVGNAAEVQDGIERMREAGVTDFAASEFTRNADERSATREVLGALIN